MAEIPIQRKEGRSIWPWIIGLIILALLIWFFMRNRRSDDTTTTRSDTTVTTSPGALAGGSDTAGQSANANGAGATSEFASWVSAVDTNRDEAGQHQYTAGGIRRLADALAAVGATGAGLDNMRKQADALQNSSASSTKHADMARSAFLSAADEFDSLKGSHSGIDVGKVRGAAEAVKPGAHLLAQKDKVQNFFETARDALQSAGGTR